MTNKRYRPKDCLDIDIEIEKVRYYGTSYIVANIAYLNRHWQGGEFLIDRQKNVRITHDTMKRWIRIL